MIKTVQWKIPRTSRVSSYTRIVGCDVFFQFIPNIKKTKQSKVLLGVPIGLFNMQCLVYEIKRVLCFVF